MTCIFDMQLRLVQPGEYFHADSLCDFANTHEKDSDGKKLIFFAVLRNSIVSSILACRKITNPLNRYFEKELDGVTFRECRKDYAKMMY